MLKAAAEPKVFEEKGLEGGNGVVVRKNYHNDDFSTIPAQTVTLKTTAAHFPAWGIKLKEMKVMGAEKGIGTGVEEVEVTAETIVDVFNLQGGCVLRGAKVMDIINLPAGIYVAGGRKYIVR